MVTCPSCSNRIRAPEFRKTERQAWKETDPTNPHFLKSLGMGFGLLLLWFGLLLPFVPPEDTPLAEYSTMQFIASLFYKHFTVSFLNTLFFSWAMSIIFLKHQKIRLQKAALLLDVLPTELGKKIHAGNVAAFIDHVYALPVRLRDSLMVNRIRKALELFEIRQNVSDVRDMMVSQSEIDSARITGSYALVRAFLWGIPLLGFIGTVVGLSHAIGGMNFANVEDVGKIVSTINNVTSGLGTAFDATLLGLSLALTLNFPLNALSKQEEDNLHTIDAFCNEVLLPRLKDTSAAKAADPAAIAHSVTQSLTGTQEKFLTDLNQLSQHMNTYANNLDRRMESFQQTITQEFVTRTAEMRIQNQAALDQAAQQIVRFQEMLSSATAARNDEMRIQTSRVLSESEALHQTVAREFATRSVEIQAQNKAALDEAVQQFVKLQETLGSAAAAKNDQLCDQTGRMLEESSEQVAKYLGGLEAGIGELNRVLTQLGEKQVVISAPPSRRRFRWFGRD
jgi:flagellar motor component MotA